MSSKTLSKLLLLRRGSHRTTTMRSSFWTTSCLLTLSSSITTTGAFGRPSPSSTTTTLSATPPPPKQHYTPLPFPPPITVPPGTSPTDQYQSSPSSTARPTNPIDSTCTILIVGSTRGIGLQFVSYSLQKGATVIATHRSSDPPPSLQTLREEYGEENLVPLRMDVSDEGSIEQAALHLRTLISKTDIGHLTHIIHNAGIYLPETSFDGTSRGSRPSQPAVTSTALSLTFQINTIAPLLISQQFVPLLHKRSPTLYPILAFVGSKVGSMDDNGSGGAYAYRSSKAALNSIAKSLSVDLGEEVRLVVLHPGWVRTDMTGGKGLIGVEESVGGMMGAVECTDGYTGFRFVDFKGDLIPW